MAARIEKSDSPQATSSARVQINVRFLGCPHDPDYVEVARQILPLRKSDDVHFVRPNV